MTQHIEVFLKEGNGPTNQKVLSLLAELRSRKHLPDNAVYVNYLEPRHAILTPILTGVNGKKVVSGVGPIQRAIEAEIRT